MKKQCISVIVPVYKVEKYLEQCVESLRRQTYPDLQIVLVDDGSPDRCPQICDRYAAQDQRISVVHQTNKGLPAARNSGLKVAEGEWILFVDSDDALTDDACQILMDAVKDQNPDFVLFDMQRVIECSGRAKAAGTGERITLKQEDLFEIMQDVVSPSHLHCPRVKQSMVPAWNKLYRRSFLQDNGLTFFEDVKIHEDIPFSTRLFLAGHTGVYIQQSLYLYRKTENSILTSFRPNYFAELQPLLHRMGEILSSVEPSSLREKLYCERVAVALAQCMERCYCSPQNPNSYQTRRRAWKKALAEEVCSRALHHVEIGAFTLKKAVIIFCLKYRVFWLPNLYYRRLVK